MYQRHFTSKYSNGHSTTIIEIIIVAILLICSSIFSSSHADVGPVDLIESQQQYTSYCQPKDLACYKREIDHILLTGNYPITDRQIMEIYKVDMYDIFAGPEWEHPVNVQINIMADDGESYIINAWAAPF